MPDFQLNLDTHNVTRLFPFYFVLDRDMKIVRSGHSLQKWLGITNGDLFGEHFRLLQPASDACFDRIHSLQNQPIILETINGNRRWQGQPAPCNDDQCILFLGHPAIDTDESVANKPVPENFVSGNSLLDIPELQRFQKILEEKLEERLRFYEDILNEVPADIAVFDRDHRYLFANPKAIKDQEIREWIVGKRDEDYFDRKGISTDLIKERERIFNEILVSKKNIDWEEEIVNSQGIKEYHLRNMYPVLDENGEAKFVIGYGVDITERKKMEEQLVTNEKRYRDLYNFSQALICTHDLNGKLLSVNPAICETLGYTSDELVGRLITDFLPPENSERFREFYLDVVITDGKSKGVFPIMNKQNERLSLLYQNFKVEEEGKDSYIIGFSQDITDRIKTEEALRIAKEEVEEASMVKQTFLANMSHEIRTPMNGILGIGNLLYKTNLTPKQKEFTRLIIESGNNLLHIVNDILDLSKLQSGQFLLESTPFELADKLLSTLQAFYFKAEDKGLQLIFENNLKKGLIVEGDPYRLGQVLSNLLSNALKFTEEGKITVSVTQVNAQGKQPFFEISVTDTGMGISSDNLATIFEQFVQARADISRKYGGTGLGLTIAKNLVETQGGTIGVESKVGRGSVFTVRIPYKISSESVLKKELRKSGGFKSTERKKILVAEDVPVNQLIAKHILKSWGHIVSVAENGKEVLKMLEKNNYDLILMDIHMPEMNGVVATRQIRKLRNSRKANIPIIAVTAAAFRDETERYLEAGMNEFITKPYTEEKLFEVIKRVLKMETTDNNPDESGTGKPEKSKEKVYDLSTLLQFGDDDPSFIKDIITLFITNGRQDLHSLKTAIAAGEIQEIFQVAHRMKSSMHTMGIRSAEAAIKRIDFCSRNNENIEEIPGKYAEVERILLIAFDQLMADFGIVC